MRIVHFPRFWNFLVFLAATFLFKRWQQKRLLQPPPLTLLVVVHSQLITWQPPFYLFSLLCSVSSPQGSRHFYFLIVVQSQLTMWPSSFFFSRLLCIVSSPRGRRHFSFLGCCAQSARHLAAAIFLFPVVVHSQLATWPLPFFFSRLLCTVSSPCFPLRSIICIWWGV